MKWRRITRCARSEVRAIALILAWTALYFNIYRFTVVQSIGHWVPIGAKLASFLVFLAGALYAVNGIYKGILAQSPGQLSPIWFAVDFLLSMGFAVACADRQILFRMLSVSIFACDRVLYYVVYRKQFRRAQLVP